MSVCSTVSVPRFYGCCHPCFYKSMHIKRLYGQLNRLKLLSGYASTALSLPLEEIRVIPIPQNQLGGFIIHTRGFLSISLKSNATF